MGLFTPFIGMYQGSGSIYSPKLAVRSNSIACLWAYHAEGEFKVRRDQKMKNRTAGEEMSRG